MHHISFSKICYVQFVCLLFILFSIKKTFIRLKRNVVRNIIIFHGSPDCFYNTFIIITKEIQSYLSQSCSVFFKYVYIYIYFFSYFSHAYVGQDYSIQKNVGKISLEQIDSVSCFDHFYYT